MAKISEYTITGPQPSESSPSHHLHKSMTIRREHKGDSPNLRSLFRTSQGTAAASPEPEQQKSMPNGVPTTPNLPPTPPAAISEHKDAVVEERASEATLFRSALVTPINQNSPPTPDDTPPRERKPPFPHPFLGTQPSMASTRAESFKTAQEELFSDDDTEADVFAMEDQTPRARNSPIPFINGTHRMPPSALVRSPLSSGAALQSPMKEDLDAEKLPETPHSDEDHARHAGHDDDIFRPLDGSPASATPSPPEIRATSHLLASEDRKTTTPETYFLPRPGSIGNQGDASVRRGPSLRDRLKAAQRDSPSASTEKFASIIGWNNSVPTTPGQEDRRFCGPSTGSTIGAFVFDSSPLPRRRTTLRHVTKHDSLRSASSPIPIQSNRDSLNSNSDSPHRLVHKKARLSNQNRWSFGSEVSRPYSISSSAVVPKTEVIRVAVIPERGSSLQSSANSSKRHSLSTNSGKAHSRKASENLPPSSWQRNRTVSESHQHDRARDKKQNIFVPPRSSSLSAPTSRSTSRANSITSEHLRVRRLEAETDLRKTLDQMESERLITTLRGLNDDQMDVPIVHRQQENGPNLAFVETPKHRTAPNHPRHSLPHEHDGTERQSLIVPGSKEWAALRPTSLLETPYSQPSFWSASPEINEAKAVNLFPHNNHSLQLIEPNLMQESRAVREVRKQQNTRIEAEADSPLRNPREPPQPPAFRISPSAAANGQSQYLNQPARQDSQRRPLPRRQSESFVKSFSRSLSLRNAKNKKADQDLDGSLHPFWRPRGFWDDVDENRPEPSLARDRGMNEPGIVNNSLGLPQERTVITGPVSLVRRISERRRQNRALIKQSSQNSLHRLRASRKLYQAPVLGLNLRFMGLHDIQDRLLYARQRKEDERRERRRAALRESIGPNVISQGDSRFPASESNSLLRTSVR